MLCYNMSTKTYRFGLSGIKTIAVLGLSVTKTKVFLWYDVMAKTKRWWHGGSVREDPLTIEVGSGKHVIQY